MMTVYFGVTPVSFADEFTSSSFKVLDPVIAPAGFSTSAGFQLWSTIAEIAVGTSSASSFQMGAGFLRYPFASTPSLSATAGDAQVILSWSASSGYVGWTASGYSVGQSSVSGGPYTYTSVGSTLASTRSGLTNSSTYYFVVVVKDVFGNYIATSTQVSATPAASSATPVGGGTVSGGGGGPAPSSDTQTSVVMSGRAYPLSKVTFLKDGQVALTTIAGPDSNFTGTLKDLSAGNYTFSVYSEDSNGIRSNPFSFPAYLTRGVTTQVSGIFLAPTIAVDKSEVKRGDTITIFGQSSPSSLIVINVNSEPELFISRQSDQKGVYLLNLDSSLLEVGTHSAKSKATLDGEVSAFSNTVGFRVGTKNVTVDKKECAIRADLNSDCRVNLVDFSIAAFWYKKTLSESVKVLEKERLNGDGVINLIDLSIMAFNWTG